MQLPYLMVIIYYSIVLMLVMITYFICDLNLIVTLSKTPDSALNPVICPLCDEKHQFI